jgi:hypothetical protein
LRPFNWALFLSRNPDQCFDPLPNLPTVTLGFKSPSPDDFPFPVRQRNPVFAIKKERRFQKDATELVVVRRARFWGSSVPGDPSTHLLLSRRSVLFPECLPDHARGQDREVAEEPATGYVIVRAVKFEEKWFADLESPELLLAAGLPEVDFMESVNTGKKIEPVTIRDSDEEAHLLSCNTVSVTAEFYAANGQF